MNVEVSELATRCGSAAGVGARSGNAPSAPVRSWTPSFVYTPSVNVGVEWRASSWATFAGVHLSDGAIMTIANSLITDNRWSIGGGGVAAYDSRPTLTNCTIVGNANGGLYSAGATRSRVQNCVFSDNGGLDLYSDFSGVGRTDVSHTLISSEILSSSIVIGDGVTELTDPQLDSEFRPLAGSPLIDAGDNTLVPAGILTDLAGNDRFIDDPLTPDTGIGDPPIVDLGAYEFDPALLQPDLDGDGWVTIRDLAILLSGFGQNRKDADVNGDGRVNLEDLAALLAWFGHQV